MHRPLRMTSAVLAALSLASCSTVGFYQQAATGQAEILLKRQPVERVLADPSTEDTLRARLELSQKMLDFAATELDMPSGGSFTGYTDLGRPHVVWVLHAAPELSMEPKTWWYPVVGRQEYRGYFSETGARRLERSLQASGYETWLSQVDAYSTLGYFRDPLLNTYIHREEPLLAELLFHELAHQRHFRSGETAFNEGLAEAVGREGVRRWLASRGNQQGLDAYEARLRRLAAAGAQIQRTAARLDQIYQSDRDPPSMRAAKEAEIAELRRRLAAMNPRPGSGLADWVTGTLNNARINSFTAYEDEVPRFTGLLAECGGDFREFWHRVKTLDP